MSKVSICNQALNKINVSAILSLTENSKQARTCNLVFEQVYKTALTIRSWNFATTRIELARLAIAPISGYLYSYKLPNDCLKVIDVVNTINLYAIDYSVEGDNLTTDESSVQITYIKYITDFSLLPPLFTAYLINHLAYEISFSLTGNVSLQDRLSADADNKMEEAKKADSTESSPKVRVNSTVINRRYSGTSGRWYN